MEELCEAADLILEQNKRSNTIAAVSMQNQVDREVEADPVLEVEAVQRAPTKTRGQGQR